MSDTAQAILASVLLIIAAGWIGILSRQAHRSPVVWLRPVGGRFRHAISRTALLTQTNRGSATLTALGRGKDCGRWDAVVLARDRRIPRCPACTQVADSLRHRCD